MHETVLNSTSVFLELFFNKLGKINIQIFFPPFIIAIKPLSFTYILM